MDTIPYLQLEVVPVTIGQAKAFVDQHHRHMTAPRSGLFATGLASGPDLVGVVIVGRPVARELDDGWTAEVVRLCVLPGYRNGCSKLYAAAWRAARALGYRSLITYTLRSEPGTSLRAAGWHEVAAVKDRRRGTYRPGGHADQEKRRWEKGTGVKAWHTPYLSDG